MKPSKQLKGRSLAQLADDPRPYGPGNNDSEREVATLSTMQANELGPKPVTGTGGSDSELEVCKFKRYVLLRTGQFEMGSNGRET
jgi:hypothetical protein